MVFKIATVFSMTSITLQSTGGFHLKPQAIFQQMEKSVLRCFQPISHITATAQINSRISQDSSAQSHGKRLNSVSKDKIFDLSKFKVCRQHNNACSNDKIGLL